MNLRYSLLDAEDAGERRMPSIVIEELGIKYTRWESHPICEQIWLINVDEATLPKPLPSYLRRFTTHNGQVINLDVG